MILEDIVIIVIVFNIIAVLGVVDSFLQKVIEGPLILSPASLDHQNAELLGNPSRNSFIRSSSIVKYMYATMTLRSCMHPSCLHASAPGFQRWVSCGSLTLGTISAAV